MFRPMWSSGVKIIWERELLSSGSLLMTLIIVKLIDITPLFSQLYRCQVIYCDDECTAVGGMRIGRGNRSTLRKPAPVPLCPPQIPEDLTLLLQS
jgi:hypothetical protein